MQISQSYLCEVESRRPQEAPLHVVSANRSKLTETLLVVDNDIAVLEVEAKVLRRGGYCVLQAESAEEALRVAASTAGIHLLVTDFAMPKVDGLELIHRFRAMHQLVPVLMVSGSLSLISDKTRELNRFDILAKPFSSQELLGKVRTLLDAFLVPSEPVPPCCE
jgi:DNA-binding response OmpR family regulator